MVDKKIIIFGKKYDVMFREAKYNKIVQSNKKVYVYFRDKKPERLLNRYLRNLLYSYILQLLQEFTERGLLCGVIKIKIIDTLEKPTILARLRGNYIELSHKLVYAPKSIIRYVLAHELSHLLVKNHTTKFFAILDALLPEGSDMDQHDLHNFKNLRIFS